MTRHCLWIGWAGADWELARPLMRAGKMPHLARLAEAGVVGETVGIPPYSSPLSWATAATGLHADEHGVLGYATAGDRGVRPTGTGDWKAKAIWSLLGEAGKSVAVAGWPATFPAGSIRGSFISDAFAFSSPHPDHERPSVEGGVSPPALAAELADLRLRDQDVDTRLLGLFVPEARNQGHEADPQLEFLRGRLAELYSLHNAALVQLSRGVPDFAAVHFPFLRAIAERFLSYHPPRHPRVGRRDFVRYSEVVSAAYRLQDALLGELLGAISGETLVMLCSDHGFLTGEQFPGPTRPAPDSNPAMQGAYRPTGIFVAAGPGVEPAQIGPVRLDDIAPTLLACFGHPKRPGMRGRTIDELTREPVDSGAPTREMAPPASPLPGDGGRILRVLAERKIVAPSVLTEPGRPAGLERQNRITLGTALLEQGRPLDALPSLQGAALEEPESRVAALPLVRALLNLAMREAAQRAAQPFLDYGFDRPEAVRLRARLLMAKGEFGAALRLFDNPSSSFDREVQLLILAHSSHQTEAVASFQAELAKSPNRALLHLGLGNAWLRIDRPAEAVSALERALELDRGLEMAERLLAEARQRLRGIRPVPPSWATMAETVSQIKTREEAYRAREEKRRPPLPSVPDESGGRPAEDWSVRAAAADEDERLRKYFSLDFASFPERGSRWVIEAQSPPRIVAVIQRREIPDEGWRLQWEIREAWKTHPAAERLVRTAIEHALKTRTLPILAEVNDDLTRALAQRLGFERVWRREVSWISSRQVLDRGIRRYGKQLEADPVPFGPLRREDAERVRKICEGLGVRHADLVRPRIPGGRSGFDLELSFRAGDADNPALILLAREDLGAVYVETLARNPAVPEYPVYGVVALLMGFFQALADQGFDRIYFQTTAGERSGLGPIARRFGSETTQFWEIMRWQGDRTSRDA